MAAGWRVRLAHRLELGQQALAQIERRRSRRVEGEDHAPHRLDLGLGDAERGGELRHGGVQVAPLVEVSDDLDPDIALPLGADGGAELLGQVFGQRAPGGEGALQRGRILPERQAAGVLVVVPVEVLRLDFRHRVAVGLREDLLVFLFVLFPVLRAGRVEILGAVLLAIRQFLERRVLEQLLLHPEPQLHEREGEHLDGLADLGRERQPLLLPDPDPEFGARRLHLRHRHSKFSPR